MIGDYLLWNWSLNANHAAIALISGLTLPPLTLAALWLLAVGVARLIARTTRRPSAGRGGGTKSAAAAQAPRPSAGALAREQSVAPAQAAASSSRKLAA
jgi:hypothetical protein